MTAWVRVTGADATRWCDPVRVRVRMKAWVSVKTQSRIRGRGRAKVLQQG